DAAGWLTFAALTWLLRSLFCRHPRSFSACWVSWWLRSLLCHTLSTLERASLPRGGTDLPARMAAATSTVLLLTTVAPTLGPHVSDLLAPFPVFATILGIFTHVAYGLAPAVRLLRGVVLGKFAFAAFFLRVDVLIQQAGLAMTFALAAIVALSVQATTLWLVNRGS